MQDSDRTLSSAFFLSLVWGSSVKAIQVAATELSNGVNMTDDCLERSNSTVILHDPKHWLLSSNMSHILFNHYILLWRFDKYDWNWKLIYWPNMLLLCTILAQTVNINFAHKVLILHERWIIVMVYTAGSMYLIWSHMTESNAKYYRAACQPWLTPTSITHTITYTSMHGLASLVSYHVCLEHLYFQITILHELTV